MGLPLSPTTMRFAEILSTRGTRLHVGCILAAGPDWVEVSFPKHSEIGDGLEVRMLPERLTHRVEMSWRTGDRLGFTYIDGGPGDEQFAGFPGLCDPRSALHKRIGVGKFLGDSVRLAKQPPRKPPFDVAGMASKLTRSAVLAQAAGHDMER